MVVAMTVKRKTFGVVHCPSCGWNKVKVYDSRSHQALKWRRRECQECGYRWSTVEMDQEQYRRYKRLSEAMGAALEVMEDDR